MNKYISSEILFPVETPDDGYFGHAVIFKNCQKDFYAIMGINPLEYQALVRLVNGFELESESVYLQIRNLIFENNGFQEDPIGSLIIDYTLPNQGRSYFLSKSGEKRRYVKYGTGLVLAYLNAWQIFLPATLFRKADDPGLQEFSSQLATNRQAKKVEERFQVLSQKKKGDKEGKKKKQVPSSEEPKKELPKDFEIKKTPSGQWGRIDKA